MFLYNFSVIFLVLIRCCYFQPFFFTILNRKAFYKLSSIFKTDYNLDPFYFLELVGIF